MISDPLVKNAADAEQVKEAGVKEKFGRKQELNDVYNILAIPSGRRWVWRVLSDCGVFKSSFTGNSTTFFNEGRRDIGLRILADVMEANPDAYVQMAKEAQGEK